MTDVYCRHEDCRVPFKLESSEDWLVWSLRAMAPLHPHPCTESRPLRGDRRQELAQRVRQSSAYRVTAQLAAESMDAEVPTSCALRVAAARQRLQEQVATSPVLELSSSQVEFVPPYVRGIFLSRPGQSEPTYVILWHDQGIELLRTLHRWRMPIRLGVDSTGAPIHRIKGAEAKPLYYHALVLIHPKPGEPCVAVLELLSSSQTAVTLRSVLDGWFTEVQKRVSGISVEQIVMDFNLPTLRAATHTFHGLDLVGYLQLCWRILHHEYPAEMLRRFTAIGLGRSHVVNEVRRWREVAAASHSVRVFWLCSLGAIIRCQDLQEQLRLVRALFSVLLVERLDVLHQHFGTELETLNSAVTGQEMVEENPVEPEAGEPSGYCAAIWDITLRRSSPFWVACSQLQREVSDRIAQLEMTTQAPFNITDVTRQATNQLWCPALAERLLDSLLVWLPCLSSIMSQPLRYAHGRQPRRSDHEHSFTEGAAEFWMGVVKNLLAMGKLLPLAEWIRSQHTHLIGLERLFIRGLGVLPNAEPTVDSAPSCPESAALDEATQESTAEERSSPELSNVGESEEAADRQEDPLENYAARYGSRTGGRQRRSPLAHMSNDSGLTHEAANKVYVVNKRRKKAPTAYTQPRSIPPPIPGARQRGIVPLRNHGQITGVPYDGRRVTVTVSNGCSVDCFLQALSYAYRNRPAFHEATRGAPDSCQPLRDFLEHMDAAATEKEAACARARLLLRTPALWAAGNCLLPAPNGSVRANLYASEVDMASYILGPAIAFDRLSLCQFEGCPDSVRRIASHAPIMVHEVAPLHVIEQLRHSMNPHAEGLCSECGGMRDFSSAEFTIQPPPFLALGIPDHLRVDSMELPEIIRPFSTSDTEYRQLLALGQISEGED